MGANATTFVPAYIAGEVLTAADLTVTNSGIPVFADSTARAAAFGGSGEKVLAAGQYAFLESDNGTYVYNGSAWVSVGVTPGIVLTKTQTIGSGVSSITVSDAFSATYDNYKITITGGTGSINQIGLRITMGSNTAGVQGVAVGAEYGGATYAASAINNGAYFDFVGMANNTSIFMSGEIHSPYLAENTFAAFTGSRFNSNGYPVGSFYELLNTTSYTAFTITMNQGTLTGGTIRIYGYANS
jgi:hypothetical protein